MKKQKEFTLPSGTKIIAEFGNSYSAYLKNKVKDPMIVDDVDIRDLHWNEFFTGGRLTSMLYNYKPDGCYVCPFVKNPDKDSVNKIGMYLSITDDSADDIIKERTSYGRILYRPCIGELMFTMYIAVEKSILNDRRDHSYSVNIEKGVSYIYEHFKERINVEASEGLKQQLYHAGGLLTGAVSVAATSPRKVFEFINKVTAHII